MVSAQERRWKKGIWTRLAKHEDPDKLLGRIQPYLGWCPKLTYLSRRWEDYFLARLDQARPRHIHKHVCFSAIVVSLIGLTEYDGVRRKRASRALWLATPELHRCARGCTICIPCVALAACTSCLALARRYDWLPRLFALPLRRNQADIPWFA